MKKKIVSITLLFIAISFLICIILLCFKVYNVFADPGGRKKYQIGIPNAVKETTKEFLSANDEARIIKFIKDSVVKFEHKYTYDAKSCDTVSFAKDTLLDYKIGKILLKDKNIKIYFITILHGTNQIGNDTIKPKIFDEILSCCAIYVDEYKKEIRDISYFRMGFQYDHYRIQPNDELSKNLEKESIQYTLYRYNYYLINFWLLKIINNSFWENIETNNTID